MRGRAPYLYSKGALHMNVGQHTHTRAVNLWFHTGHIQLWGEHGTFIPTLRTPIAGKRVKIFKRREEAYLRVDLEEHNLYEVGELGNNGEGVELLVELVEDTDNEED